MSKRCDREFPGIGRIARATGTTTKADYRRCMAILDELYDAGRWDVLEAIRDGRASIREVCAAYRARRLDRLWGDVLLGRDLADAVQSWLTTSARVQATRTRYGVSWNSLSRAGVLRPKATLGDLERVDWAALRGSWSGGRHDWRHLRGFLSRFLSVQLGVDHPFRKGLLAKVPRAGRGERRSPAGCPISRLKPSGAS
jgi:hypothetical protein